MLLLCDEAQLLLRLLLTLLLKLLFTLLLRLLLLQCVILVQFCQLAVPHLCLLRSMPITRT